MEQTAVALYHNENEAQQVISALKQAGFNQVMLHTKDNNSDGVGIDDLCAHLTDAGVPDDDAKFYEQGIRKGGALVHLQVDEKRADEASRIMDQSRHGSMGNGGAMTGGGSMGADKMNTAGSTDRMAGQTTDRMNEQGERVLPVVEETLKVGKRDIEQGGVRVHTRVTETPVNESVSLHEERVDVERRPVDRPVSDADQAFREGTIEVTARSEEAVVSKQARVVEEVVVSKESSERTQQISDTVRRTDVEVEQVPGTKRTS